MLALLLLCFSVAQTVHAACPAPGPIVLPITNVLLENGNYRRGIPLAVGTPPQNFSVLPHMFLNNTWIYNDTASFCSNTNMAKAQCFTSRGGLYDPGASSSSSGGVDVYTAGGDTGDVQRLVGPHIWFNQFVTDDLHVGNTTLIDFPIGMPGLDISSWVDKQANLGLGRNSTLLNALVASGDISSRVYSFWWGRDSASSEAAMDGQLVLGGYDAAKASGDNITLPIQPWGINCPSGMLVTIGDLILDFTNGTSASMLYPSTSTACLQSDVPAILSLNLSPYWYNFQNLTGTDMLGLTSIDHTYLNTPQYPPDQVYNGDMTMVLNDGLRLTFSNDVLAVPDQYVDQNGVSQTNSSVDDILFVPRWGDNVNDQEIAGTVFFSAAYVMVNLDEETYTIWPANPTTDTKLVAIGGNCDDAVQSPNTNATPTNNSSSSNSSSSGNNSVPTNTQSSSNQEKPNHAIPIGLIVGAVVGAAVGAAGLATIAVLLVLRHKRRRRQQTGSRVVHPDDGSRPADHFGNSGSNVIPRSEAMSVPVSELAGWQTHPIELKGTEKPHEMMGHEARSPQTSQRTGFKVGNGLVMAEME